MTIYTSLIGGLGNQMFQYAAARALSLRKHTELRLDISGFASYGLHQGFELERVFACPTEIASASEIDRLLGWQSNQFIRRLLLHSGFAVFRRNTLVVEPYFDYWPGIEYLGAECYLSGYWQSEKYFADMSMQIRADFTFKQPLAGKNIELAKQINLVNAVSLHVRRGDYVHSQRTNSTHGLCPLEYYQEAIRYVAERVEHPQFFIFSDDIEWVKRNLKIDFPLFYVQHNRGKESYNDMRLMSLCRHHIIANSSFSWWGAWLNANTEKIVLAPKKWFAKQTDVRDLFPGSWITL